MRSALLVAVSTCAISFVSASGQSAATFWNGSWKLDSAKGTPPNISFTLSRSQDGAYTSDNGNYKYTFRCDGKDYPKIDAVTISCSADPTEMSITLKNAGKLASRGIWKLSQDGDTLLVTGSLENADGVKKLKDRSYRRVSRSSGFLGSWKATDDADTGAERMVTTLHAGIFRTAFPSVGQDTEMKLDGTDAPIHGRVPQGATMAATLQAPLTITLVRKLKGVVLNQGLLTMSPDGQSLTYVWWKPEHPELKGKQVYERER